MTPDQLREAWFTFFEERDHTRYPSSSLVPENDPTLLFAGAGMNQFKAMFVGKGNLPFSRAVTIQKCFRQGDLENVGKTPRHLTFFEMMGHFSFGDYFKKEAIEWAWTFLLEVAKLPADRLWVSVFEDDEEAYEAWKHVGVPEERIARFDVKENFWPANAPEKGPNGPCGPCTEIFFDYGPEAEVGDGGPAAYDSGRFIEIWNSVFTQYDRRGVNELEELPQKNIDCGAGFERVLMAIEGVRTPFATSLFRPIVAFIAELAGKPYDFDENGGWPEGDDQNRMRRIAEHARAACMIIADGVKPSNEGRGYVLRRVMRRAIRDGIQLGLQDGFLAQMVDPVIDAMGAAYPQLSEGRAALTATIGGEEKRFRQTFNTGLRYLEDEVAKLGKAKRLSGEAAFKLYDTYGFPVDLAQVMLEERGIAVDLEGFEREMEAQRERARAGSKIQADIFAGGPVAELTAAKVAPTRFLGYEGDGVEGQGVIVGLIGADNALVDEVSEGDDVTVVLDATPFYAESGGQVGDAGRIETENGAIQILDTQKVESFHLHQGHVVVGTIHEGDAVRSQVDAAARASIRRNHTATHLMHEALKRVLGDHVRQEGSPGRRGPAAVRLQPSAGAHRRRGRAHRGHGQRVDPAQRRGLHRHHGARRREGLGRGVVVRREVRRRRARPQHRLGFARAVRRHALPANGRHRLVPHHDGDEHRRGGAAHRGGHRHGRGPGRSSATAVSCATWPACSRPSPRSCTSAWSRCRTSSRRSRRPRKRRSATPGRKWPRSSRATPTRSAGSGSSSPRCPASTPRRSRACGTRCRRAASTRRSWWGRPTARRRCSQASVPRASSAG